MVGGLNGVRCDTLIAAENMPFVQWEVNMQGFGRSEFPPKNQCVASNCADQLFALGVKYSTDYLSRHDLVMAHMYFNLAACKGHLGAIERRLEVAAEMSATEIVAAQRAARISLAVQ